jgi:iron complex transport system substrate-binding protein
MKICSLLPSGTEILFALGLGADLIGVSDLCDHPPDAMGKRVVSRSKVDPSILSSAEVESEMRRLLEAGEELYQLDREWLIENAPDVVLTQDLCCFCEVDAGQVMEAVDGLLQATRVIVLQPRTVGEILTSIDQVGEACHAEIAAGELVTRLRSRIDAVTGTLEQAKIHPRVFSIEGVDPLVIGGHWIPDLLRLAGGSQEIYPPGCPAQRIGWEEIVDYAPDKLYIDLCSSDLARNIREVPWLAAQTGWDRLPAVQSGEVYIIDHVYLSRPGPRVVQGLEIMAQLTHPDLFSGLIPQGAVAKLDPGLAKGRPADRAAECFRPYPE